MAVKSNRINTSVSFAFANIAENNLNVKTGDLLSFTEEWFVTKATPETVVMWIANDKAVFPENNETVEQWRVDYNPVIRENTYKMNVAGGDTSALIVGHFYTMNENQELDPSTDSPSVWQFMVQDIYANSADVRFVTNLGLAINQYEDVRLVAVYPTNPESSPFDGQYTFELSNGTKIDWDFSDLCRWTTDIEFGGNVTVGWNLQVIWNSTLWDVAAWNVEATSFTWDITSENANLENVWIHNASVDTLATESMEIQDLDVTGNIEAEGNIHVKHDIDIDEDLNVDGSAHIWESATVDHVLTVWEQLTLWPNATAPQFVMEATRNQANWFAGLNANGQLDNSVLPPLAIWETYVEDTEAKMLALQAQTGDVCVRTDETKTYIKLNDNNPATLADWQVLLFPGQNAWWQITGDINDQLDLINKLSNYAEISNLKTINWESIVWTGDIEVDGIEKSATAPENPTQGDVYYNTTDDTIYSYNGSERVAVGSGSFDPDGYYPNLHAWLADNLYTADNIIDIDVWNFRTTAGSESVPSSGIASLNNLKGNAVRTVAKTWWTIEFQSVSQGIFITNVNKYWFIYNASNTSGTYTFTLTSGSWDIDPSVYWITVDLQQDQFDIENWTFTDDGTTFKTFVDRFRWRFRMLYDTDNSVWELSDWVNTWTDADTTTRWITTPGSTDTVVYVNYFDECTDGSITIVFTAENAGTIIISNPAKLLATGVNQYDGTTYIDNAEINASGEIVAWSNKVCYVYAYGWVNNWYMWYSADGYIVNCGRLATEPQIGDTLDQTNINVWTIECDMPFADTWYFVVEVSDDTWLSIHPKRSGQQDTNTDTYETSEVDIPTEDVNSTSLPTATIWLPAVGDYCDEINFQTNKYFQRVQTTALDYGDLATLIEDNASNPDFVYDYDSTYIYYYDWTVTTYDISWDRTYTANDYWTERFLDSNDDIIDVPVEANTSYGSNLVDKLRTWVVTKEEYPQVITQAQYDLLPSTKDTDWIIRFIYTVE